MSEGQSIREVEPSVPLADAIKQIFERRATHGERKLILESYQSKFDKLLETLPKEKRDTTAIKIQKFGVKIGAYLSEYGARFSDFVRNVFVWPMIAATEDFPKDKYYQIELARAKAWGDFARDTTITATAERMAYRDFFLPNALVGAGTAGTLGLFGGLAVGATEGTKIGVVTGGLYGAAIGAAVGAAIGGGTALVLQIKDRLLGPPVLYYSLFSGSGAAININSGSTSTLSTAIPKAV